MLSEAAGVVEGWIAAHAAADALLEVPPECQVPLRRELESMQRQFSVQLRLEDSSGMLHLHGPGKLVGLARDAAYAVVRLHARRRRGTSRQAICPLLFRTVSAHSQPSGVHLSRVGESVAHVAVHRRRVGIELVPSEQGAAPDVVDVDEGTDERHCWRPGRDVSDHC